ncbi:MAG: hypothetical protein IOD12_02225 [Silvanigrellales bacterium]|nr:hypothetical protein [Silvanigrellales bacterium]
MNRSHLVVFFPLFSMIAVGCAKDASDAETKSIGLNDTSLSTGSVECQAAPKLAGSKHWAKEGNGFKYSGAPDLGALGRNLFAARIRFELKSDLVQNNMSIYGGITEAPVAGEGNTLRPLEMAVSTGSKYTVNFEVQKTRGGNWYASKIHVDANIGSGQTSRSTYDCKAPNMEFAQDPKLRFPGVGVDSTARVDSEASKDCKPVSISASLNTSASGFPRNMEGAVTYKLVNVTSGSEVAPSVTRHVFSTGYSSSASFSTKTSGMHTVEVEFKPKGRTDVYSGQQTVDFGNEACPKAPSNPSLRIDVR